MADTVLNSSLGEGTAQASSPSRERRSRWVCRINAVVVVNEYQRRLRTTIQGSVFRREICLLLLDSGAPRSPPSSRNIWGAQDDQGNPIVQNWKCAPIYLWWQLTTWSFPDRPDRTWCDPRASERTDVDRSEEAFYMFAPKRFVYIPEITWTGVARSRREIIWNTCGQSYFLDTETKI